MKSFRPILLAVVTVCSQFLLTASSPAQSSPNLYKVFISLDGVTTNDFGRLIRIFAGKSDIVSRCATQNSISNLNYLTLVYDRDADAVEVVIRTNGAVVCSPLAFSGGFALSNTNDTVRQRIAFVYTEGSADASGTIIANERFAYGTNGVVTGYSLNGKLQFALTPTDRSSKIFSGFVTTGPRFIPGTRNF